MNNCELRYSCLYNTMDGVYLICYYYYYLKITLISIDLINMTLSDGIDSAPIFVSIRQILHHGGFQMCKLNPTAGTTIAKMERDFTMIWIINSNRYDQTFSVALIIHDWFDISSTDISQCRCGLIWMERRVRKSYPQVMYMYICDTINMPMLSYSSTKAHDNMLFLDFLDFCSW